MSEKIYRVQMNSKGMPNFSTAVEVADRPQGEWKPFDLTWGRSIWYCTACEESTEVPCDIWTHKPIYKYCPNCGADMKGADDYEYERAIEQMEHDMLYEPTYNPEDGSM